MTTSCNMLEIEPLEGVERVKKRLVNRLIRIRGRARANRPSIASMSSKKSPQMLHVSRDPRS